MEFIVMGFIVMEFILKDFLFIKCSLMEFILIYLNYY